VSSDFVTIIAATLLTPCRINVSTTKMFET
jgi:hypothetical protein